MSTPTPVRAPVAFGTVERPNDALVEAIACRVVELLRSEPQPHGRLLTAGELAARIGTSRDTIYRHAEEYGAVRLGDGSRPRLRFDLDRVLAERAACSESKPVEPEVSPAHVGNRGRGRPRRTGTSAPLLPIHGREDRR
jgi:hypothetical protein